MSRQWEQTNMMFPRPVYMRVLMKENGFDPGPPTEAEKHDAILLLADDYADDVGLEAELIFLESSV